MFSVTILGNNSALPAHDRHPTSQVVTLNDQLLMLDCGEAAQMQLSKYKIKRSKINHIFISHLHGDHYFGLPGLINSLGLLDRKTDLHIYAPAPLKAIIDLTLNVANTVLSFPLHFHALGEEGIILDEKKFSVEAFKVNHRIECYGFFIREKKNPRKIDIQKVSSYNVPVLFYDKLRNGEDFITETGEKISNGFLTIKASPAKSYAYCADTAYTESIAEKIKNASLVYHETTYLKDLETRAIERFHSTTVQAGKIAKLANATRLIVGHFSSKYERLDDFLTETKAVFENTDLALEGVTYIL
jgi:ribonuclease Z